MGALRGLYRRVTPRLRTERVVIDLAADTSPAWEPLYVAPSAAPSKAGVAGSVYVDSTKNVLMLSDGTDYNPAGGLRTVKTGAATLTAADSGALCVFNAAAGFTYTLPAAKAGLFFDFVVDTTCTSSVHRVACATGDFLSGTIMQGTDGTFTIGLQTANGSTHLAWEGNGSTTGGIKGDWFRVVAISGTKWQIWGFNTATGTEATPFKTS